MIIKDIEHFQGGEGTLHFEFILSEEEMHHKNRVYARITLKPGCTVGYHVHNGDDEDIFVLSGTATIDDNHERMITLNPGEHYTTVSGKGHSLQNNSNEDVVVMALIVYQ